MDSQNSLATHLQEQGGGQIHGTAHASRAHMKLGSSTGGLQRLVLRADEKS
jgi:hypothetical protein